MSSIFRAFFTSPAVGGTVGMMELMNAFVMLDDRPVIFIGVGILNSDRYFIRDAL